MDVPDSLPPAFLPGYPTAVNISGDAVALAAATYEPATVLYVVVDAAEVSRAAECRCLASVLKRGAASAARRAVC